MAQTWMISAVAFDTTPHIILVISIIDCSGVSVLCSVAIGRCSGCHAPATLLLLCDINFTGWSFQLDCLSSCVFRPIVACMYSHRHVILETWAFAVFCPTMWNTLQNDSYNKVLGLEIFRKGLKIEQLELEFSAQRYLHNLQLKMSLILTLSHSSSLSLSLSFSRSISTQISIDFFSPVTHTFKLSTSSRNRCAMFATTEMMKTMMMRIHNDANEWPIPLAAVI